ncbi:MAG: RNA polymerase sporulation sigma factor SigH [Lachnospiraceae bacterium]|nr:RNA polymerase sporulation sigma factor SigH [Lachnospira sp.]MBR6698316.1 RNA polymerase sporulation sigma factor SigH [Lachnospiraceae bacterium]
MKNFENCSDEEILEKYGKDDEEVVAYFLNKYKGMVRKKARALYIVGGDSEDLIQEGMIGLYKAIRDYNATKEATLFTFATLCVERQMYTAIRSSNSKKNEPLNSYISFDAPLTNENEESKFGDFIELSKAQSPEELIIDRENVNRIEGKIDTCLSKFEKQVIQMYLEGVSYTKIAQILDKTPKSIDNALQRIRNKLSKVI